MGIAHGLKPPYNHAVDTQMVALIRDIRQLAAKGPTSFETPRDFRLEWTHVHHHFQDRVKYLLSEGFDVCEESWGLTISWANAILNPNHKGIRTYPPTLGCER